MSDKLEIITYALVETMPDGTQVPMQDWTENGRTVSIGETVTIGWGSLAGKSGKILRFCSHRTDRFEAEVELPDGTKSIWPLNAIMYASQEELDAKPPRWRVQF